MSLIKKNPVFTAVIFICIAAFGAEAFLAWQGKKSVDGLEKKIRSKTSRLTALVNAEVTPTDDNVAASTENLRNLEAIYELNARNLRRGSGGNQFDPQGISTSEDLYFNLLNFGVDLREVAKGAKVKLRDGEMEQFGFARFITEGKGPPPVHIPAVYKQRMIIDFIVRKLFETHDPELGGTLEIVAVQRERVIPEVETSTRTRGKPNTSPLAGDVFRVPEEVTARVPGAIDTMGFRIVFTGKTDNLRNLLTALGEDSGMPLVVRSVEVKASAKPKEEDTRSVASLFGSTDEDVAAPNRIDIVTEEDTYSQFSVTIEYFEVVQEKPRDEPTEG